MATPFASPARTPTAFACLELLAVKPSSSAELAALVSASLADARSSLEDLVGRGVVDVEWNGLLVLSTRER